MLGGYTLRHALTLSIAKAKKPRVRKKILITLVSKGVVAVEALVSRNPTGFTQRSLPQTSLLGLNMREGQAYRLSTGKVCSY